jgi:ABC-2 type transport system permease protein
MAKLFSAFKKEFLLLIRDIPGLLILFLMPVVLVMIVTVAQQNAVKNSRESKTNVLFIDKAHTAASLSLERDLANSGIFLLVKKQDDILLDEKRATELISRGEHEIGIVVTENDSAIHILADPALQESYRNSLIGSLTYFIRGSQSRIALETLLKTMAPSNGEWISQVMNDAIKNLPPVRDIYPTRNKSTLKPTLSQNCIPGFILFAMFFIVIPLSGSIINEKNEGSSFRLRTMPVRVYIILSAKILLYLVICLVQFVLMLMTGIWLLPVLFGLPEFTLGHQYLPIILITVSSGLAAIGFGLMVGTFASTHAQSALFGSVVVVALSIISGAFLPVHLFPDAIQYMSLISPIRWGIDAYLEIFIRESSLLTVVPHILFLLLFFLFAMMISIFNFARQKKNRFHRLLLRL